VKWTRVSFLKIRTEAPGLSPNGVILNKASKINTESPIQWIAYGKRWSCLKLWKKEISQQFTWQRKSDLHATGTLANQLAIAALSGNQPKSNCRNEHQPH